MSFVTFVWTVGMNHMKAIRLETQSKWDSLGFLEGLKGHVKDIAQLYENQASTLLFTTATNSGSFETVVFPIVRRVFSKLLANDIVSVQAMNMPVNCSTSYHKHLVVMTVKVDMTTITLMVGLRYNFLCTYFNGC
jgi:hypothetical protein